MWLHLQGSKLDGYKFSRQIDVGGFHPDFVCRSHKLIIELDGGSHDFAVEEDAFRTRCLNDLGYQVIRFTNADVFNHPEGVLTVISAALRDRPTPALRARPSRKREGK